MRFPSFSFRQEKPLAFLYVCFTLRLFVFQYCSFFINLEEWHVDASKPFNDQCSHHIETSQLICSAGFYMIRTSFAEGFNEYHISIR